MDYGEYYKSFDPYPYYEERGWLIGDGRIGGKAKGLSFAHFVLSKNGLTDDVHLPDYSFVITTSVFNEFMEINNFWEKLENLRAHTDGPIIYKACAEARLPYALDEPLEKILDLIQTPLCVRSSSLASTLHASRRTPARARSGARSSRPR